MTQLDKEHEFINLGLQPNLRKLVTGDTSKFIRKIRIPTFGTPAPTLDGKSAAIWVSDVPNHIEELGVLAVCIAPGEKVSPFDRQWFCGVLAVSSYARAVQGLTSDELFVPRTVIEAANFGPNILVDACGLLESLYRK